MLVFLSLPLPALAGVEVLFSPRDNINYRTIEAINLSEDCIDVATFDFTSREIADALVNARSKGLKIRLLVDKKLLEDEGSQVKYLEEKGFDIKALKGKNEGAMKNSFAIFDGRLVIVGPYQLANEEGSYNYENAIFFDDQAIIETYQSEFDRLFGRRTTLTTATKESKDSLLSAVIQPPSNLRQGAGSNGSGVTSQESVASASKPTVEPQPGLEEQTATTEVKTAIMDTETVTDEKQPAALTTNDSPSNSPHPDPLPQGERELPPPLMGGDKGDGEKESPESFVDIAFEELDKIFGKDSALSDVEKNALWVAQYWGRYVKWTGEVTYTLLGLVKGTRIGFRHKADSGGLDTDVEVRFSIKKATKIMRIAEGDTVTYTAKLFSYPTSDTPYYVLNEGSLE